MRGYSNTNWTEEHRWWIEIWKERCKYVLIGQPILGKIKHMSHYMNWYWANSTIHLTWFATHPNVSATSCLAQDMESEQHPPQQSPPIIINIHDEGLQPHAQSYEFTLQPHHHQEDYGYNPQFFIASKEDFMSNLMDIDLRTPESAYAYMQSMPILSFASFHHNIADSSSTNDFVWKSNMLFLINNLNHKNMASTSTTDNKQVTFQIWN